MQIELGKDIDYGFASGGLIEVSHKEEELNVRNIRIVWCNTMFFSDWSFSHHRSFSDTRVDEKW